MQILAKTIDGKSVSFEVTKSDTILDIKKKIQEKLALTPEEQNLIFEGRILEDEKTADDYKIVEKSVINVRVKLRNGLQIFAKTLDGETVSLEVTKSDTVLDVKKKIQEKTGLKPEEQKLIFKGEILDDIKTVEECEIVEKSVVNVVTK